MSVIGDVLGIANQVPPWALEAAFGLVKTVVKLIEADNDDDREEALMQAAELTKVALDKKKFGR